MIEALAAADFGAALGAATFASLPAYGNACTSDKRFGRGLLGSMAGLTSTVLGLATKSLHPFVWAPIISLFGAALASELCSP